MKIRIDHKFLVFPVNTLAAEKRLTFSAGGDVVYALDIRLNAVQPDFWAYIHVERFMGQTLDVSVEPETALEYRTADAMDTAAAYAEPLRPQVHYTTPNGWNNDPNGMVYINGEYHLFYQHNPCEPAWGNMHWGHAVSRDMFHWQERDTALFPDETGTMFSGSGMVDAGNILGLQQGETPAVLLYYTATEPFSQYLAYSTDGLKTVHKRGGGPVVPHIAGSNRDPKVIYCNELGAYVMALYLEGDVYCLLRSRDLLHWDMLQRISLPGDDECPDFFPLCDRNGVRKWILMGASDRYLVGAFEDGLFVPCQDAADLHYGSGAYAGQSFSGLPDGRIVRMDWGRYGSLQLPGARFNGQMSVPAELTLVEREGEWRLSALPVREISCLYASHVQEENVALAAGEKCRIALEDAAQHMRIRASAAAGCLRFTVFGRTVSCSFDDNRITVGECTAPLSLGGSGLDMEIVVDRTGFEIYLDGGCIYLFVLDTRLVPDRSLPYMDIAADAACVLDSIEIHALASVWEAQA